MSHVLKGKQRRMADQRATAAEGSTIVKPYLKYPTPQVTGRGE